MMKIRNKKSSRTVKRALAFAMSFALAMSTFAVSPSADAASKKAPKLSVKKKTLYYNQAGKKTYTLKVKKNKVKAIKKTTWKTSKKSVVAISSKKKTSVKLTAKKAGTAKITATVKYTVKGSKKVQTKKLTCTVSSKKAAAVTPTATATATTAATATATAGATATATAAVTAEPTASVVPTEVPTATPAAEVKVSLDKTEAVINKEITLAAKVENADADAKVEWTSSDEKVATVADGKVTPVADGKVTITATVGSAKAECVVTVDVTAPAIEKGEVTNYQTLTVTFKEAIKATDSAKIEVFKDGASKAMTEVTTSLASDGLSASVVTAGKFEKADYTVTFTGYTDVAGNEFAKDKNYVDVKKATSTIKEFVPVNSEIPVIDTTKDAADTKSYVYYTVKDQYGEAFDSLAGTVTAKAVISGTSYEIGTDTVANRADQKNCVALQYASAMVVGKTVDVTLTAKKSAAPGAEVLGESTLTVTIAKRDGKNVASAIESYEVVQKGTNVKNEGTATAPVFTYTEGKNKFDLVTVLIDKFNLPAKTGNIQIATSNKKVVEVGETVRGTGNDAAKLTSTIDIVGAGEATLTVYLENNVDVAATIPVKVNPAEVTGVTIGETAYTVKEGTTLYNGLDTYYEVNPIPGNIKTGMNASSMSVVVTKGADLATVTLVDGKIEGINATKENTTYVKVTPKANGKENEIAFKVVAGKKETTKSVTSRVDQKVADITITADDLGANKVKVGAPTNATVVVKNAQGEDITEDVVDTLTPHSNNSAVVTVGSSVWNATDKKGQFPVTGVDEGTTSVSLTSGTVSSNVVNVTVVKASKIAEIKLANRSVEVINNDMLDIQGDTSRVKVGDFYYTPVGVTVIDQYGDVVTLTLDQWKTKTNYTAVVNGFAEKKVDMIALKKNQDGSYAAATNGNDKVAAIAVRTYKMADAIDGKSDKVYFTNGKAESANDYEEFVGLGVTALDDRYVSSIAWKYGVTSANLIVGTVDHPDIECKDQYGAVNKTDFGKIEITNEDGTVADVTSYSTGWARIDVKGLKAGTTTATVTYDNGNAKEPNPSITLPITVQKASAITKIQISNTVYVQKDGKGVEYNANNAYAAEGGIALDVAGYDASNKKVTVPFDVFTWSVVSSDVKYAEGNETVTVPASEFRFVAGGKNQYGSDLPATLVIPAVVRTKEASGTVKVKALNASNDLSATLDITISGKAPVAQSGTYMIYSKEYNPYNPSDGLVTSIDVKKSAGIYVYAKDQYGHFVTKVDMSTISFASKDEDVAEVAVDAAGITVYANTAEQTSTMITVIVDNNVEAKLTVNAKEKYSEIYKKTTDVAGNITYSFKPVLATTEDVPAASLDITSYIPGGKDKLKDYSKVIITGKKTVNGVENNTWGTSMSLYNGETKLGNDFINFAAGGVSGQPQNYVPQFALSAADVENVTSLTVKIVSGESTKVGENWVTTPFDASLVIEKIQFIK